MQNQTLTLLEAVGIYVKTLDEGDDRLEGERELFRFVQWRGSDKAVSAITPPEVGQYADEIVGTGTSPRAAQRLQAIRDFLSYAKENGLTDQNLAQHIRIRKSRTRSRKAHTQLPQESVELTVDGYNQLQAELEKLKAQRAPFAVQIRKAAADKDVRENVPLEAAREQLGHLESRITSIESTLKYAVTIDPTSTDAVQAVKLGARVFVKDLSTGREMSFTLVDRFEAQPTKNKISDASPLGKSLINRNVGQEVNVETPRGKASYRIMRITSR